MRRILLVGFMASGKSAVGRLLATELGWGFHDFDSEVERRAGRRISVLFREEGEEAFRILEAAVAHDLLPLREAVLASGGGWPCRPGRMEGLPAGTLSVWLRVSPETAVARARGEPGSRPLLARRAGRSEAHGRRGGQREAGKDAGEGPSPLHAARELLEGRERYYRKARLHVETEDREPAEVAREILDHVERWRD